MRNALSIAAGAWSLTRLPKKLLISRLKLIRPRLIVTGSISSRTRRTPGLRQSKLKLNLNGVLRRSQAGISSWTRVPTRIADRVGVDPVLAVEERLEDDEHDDDRQVPEQRRDREGAEAVVAVEDADDDAADPEQDQDREEDLGEGDREVEDLPFEAGREERHDHRREQDEERGDRAQHHRDQQQQGRGEAEGLAVVLLAEQFGEDRDEGRLQRRVGEQGADQVGDLEGDREGRHRPVDPVVAGGDDFAGEAGDARGGGGDREERGRAGDPPRLPARGRLARRVPRPVRTPPPRAAASVGVDRPLVGVGGVEVPWASPSSVDRSGSQSL